MGTSKSLGEGRSSVRAEGFYGSGIFGPQVRSHRVTLSHGLHDKVDLLVAPAFGQVHGRQPGDSRGEIYSLAAGAKYAPVPYFAATLGLGGGYSAAGGFLSPSLGFVTAYENPFFVPFFSYNLFLSAPMGVRSVHFTVDADSEARNDTDPAASRVRMKPLFTYGHQFGLGARVWLNSDEKADIRPSFLLAAGWTTLIDRFGFQQRAVYAGMSVALELQF